MGKGRAESISLEDPVSEFFWSPEIASRGRTNIAWEVTKTNLLSYTTPSSTNE